METTIEIQEQLPIAYLQRIASQVIRVFSPYFLQNSLSNAKYNPKRMKQELESLFQEFFQRCSQGSFSQHHELAIQILDFVTAYQEFERYKKNNLSRLLTSPTPQALQLKKQRDECFQILKECVNWQDDVATELPEESDLAEVMALAEKAPANSHIVFMDDWYQPFADVEWLGFRTALNYSDMLQHKIQALFYERDNWQSVKLKTESPYHAFAETILAAHESRVVIHMHYGFRVRRQDQVNHFIDIRYKMKLLETNTVFDSYLESLQKNPLKQDKLLLRISIGSEEGPAFLLAINVKENELGLGISGLSQVEVIGRINRKKRSNLR